MLLLPYFGLISSGRLTLLVLEQKPERLTARFSNQQNDFPRSTTTKALLCKTEIESGVGQKTFFTNTRIVSAFFVANLSNGHSTKNLTINNLTAIRRGVETGILFPNPSAQKWVRRITRHFCSKTRTRRSHVPEKSSMPLRQRRLIQHPWRKRSSERMSHRQRLF
jgi:hypothetical protein